MKLFPLLLSAVILTGCATVGEVTPYGKGVYIVVAKDMWGVTSQASLHAKAAKEAYRYCAGKGLHMQPATGGMCLSSPTGGVCLSGPTGGMYLSSPFGGVSSSFYFYCIN